MRMRLSVTLVLLCASCFLAARRHAKGRQIGVVMRDHAIVYDVLHAEQTEQVQ